MARGSGPGTTRGHLGQQGSSRMADQCGSIPSYLPLSSPKHEEHRPGVTMTQALPSPQPHTEVREVFTSATTLPNPCHVHKVPQARGQLAWSQASLVPLKAIPGMPLSPPSPPLRSQLSPTCPTGGQQQCSLQFCFPRNPSPVLLSGTGELEPGASATVVSCVLYQGSCLQPSHATFLGEGTSGRCH